MERKIKNFSYGLSTLSFVYALYAFLIKYLVNITPAKQEFMGAQIDNSANKNLFQLLYDYTVSMPVVFISLAIGILIIIANKYFE